MRYSFSTVVALVLILGLGACSAPKNMTYLKDFRSLSPEQLDSMTRVAEPVVKKGDKLVINVSSIDASSVAPFNLPMVAYTQPVDPSTSVGKIRTASVSQALQTYVVDVEGNINFPVLGRVKAAGRTILEMTDDLEAQISNYVDKPIVNITVANFKVTVVGEVLNPGSFYVDNDRISVFDAIGLAGDLTIYGKRTDVMVLRDNDGRKEAVYLDLTKSSVLASPYFYLQQNDVVYVDPNSKKKKKSSLSEADQYKISAVSTLVSTLSVITTLVLSLITFNR